MGSYVFGRCQSLKSIIFNWYASSFREKSFYDCNSLVYILYKDTKKPATNSFPFNECDKVRLVDVMYNYNAEKFSNYLVNRIKPPNITEITGECETNHW